MKKFLLIYFCLLFGHLANAQDITLYVKKGNVDYANQVLKAGDKQIVKKGDAVKVHVGGLALLNRDKSWVEVPQNKVLSYAELEKLIPQKKGYSSAFVTATTNQTYAKKRSAGVTTRGGQGESESYSPLDSLFILSDSIKLTVGGSAVKLQSDIKLFEISKGDTVVYSRSANTHAIVCPAPGEYSWVYTFTRDRKTYKASNYFIVPNKTKRADLEKQLQEYKNELSEFSEEMKTALIEEYCDANKIYLYSFSTNVSSVGMADLEKALARVNRKLTEKSEKPTANTRGGAVDPCERDLERLKVVFNQWENYYKKCCDGKSNTSELANILYQVTQILENGECVWEEHGEMYVIVMIYLSDLSTRMDEYPCSRKCDCGGCED